MWLRVRARPCAPVRRRLTRVPGRSRLQHLSTATEDGSIDKTTMNWVESTLQLNRSAQLPPMPASTPGRPQLTKHLSTRSSNSDIVSALGDQIVVRLLGQVLTWEFNVFEFVGHCKRRYLSLVAAEVFQQLNLFPAFDVDGDTFLLVMDKLEFTYCYVPDAPNDYHNALHATDVLQAVAVFCQVRWASSATVQRVCRHDAP